MNAQDIVSESILAHSQEFRAFIDTGVDGASKGLGPTPVMPGGCGAAHREGCNAAAELSSAGSCASWAIWALERAQL